MVLTAPISAAFLDNLSKKGMTASLYGIVTFNPFKSGLFFTNSVKKFISGISKFS
ncbi:hypothetical protein D3C85_207060 [compost metagenome]